MGLTNTRRGFLSLLGAALAAPAIVRASSLMPVRAIGIEPFPANVVLNGVPLTFNGEYLEYMDIVRRAFVPRLYIQAYKVSPSLRALCDDDGYARIDRLTEATARAVPTRAVSGLVQRT